jgi:hypothetical protein
MNLKKLFFLIFISIYGTALAQQSLNAYKYVIVPKKYEFLKLEDKYQLNSLTKFLFKKEGFETLFDNEVKPKELANNPCLGLVPKVKNNSNMFTTKLVIELVNCKNERVLVSDEGKSKQKEYKKGYQEALRGAFESITRLNYKYNPSEALAVAGNVPVKEENTIEIVKTATPVTIEKIVEERPKPVDVAKEEIPEAEEKSTIEEIQNSDIHTTETPSSLLYAQANTLGYQLVDSTPRVVYVLLKSSRKNTYFLKNKKGIVYQKNKQWIAEYYNHGKLVKKVLAIKF